MMFLVWCDEPKKWWQFRCHDYKALDEEIPSARCGRCGFYTWGLPEAY